MRICIATVAYRGWRGDEFDEALADAANAGYKFIEVQGGRFAGLVEQGESGVEECQEELGQAGLTPVVVYGPGYGGKTMEEAEQSARAITKYVKAAHQLGCRVEVSSDGPRLEGGLERIIRTLELLEPEIEKWDMKLGLEPHLNNRLERIEDYDTIFAVVKNPRIGVCIDTGHFHSAGVDVPRLIDKYPDRIFHVHIKDHLGTESVPFGQGETDNLGCLRALKRIGYQGFLSVELEVRDKAETPAYVRRAREYLEGLIAQVG